VLNLPYHATFVPLLYKIGVHSLQPQPGSKEAAAWAATTQDLLSHVPIIQQNSIAAQYQQFPSTFLSPAGIFPGHFYSYRYEAIDNNYDEFPIVLMLSKTRTHCLGLNFHYLPYDLRLALFEQFMPLIAPIPVSLLSRIYITYQRLTSITLYRAFRPCLKMYKLDRLKSQPIFITPMEWAAAITFPSERFLGKDIKTVWTESTLDVKRGRI